MTVTASDFGVPITDANYASLNAALQFRTLVAAIMTTGAIAAAMSTNAGANDVGTPHSEVRQMNFIDQIEGVEHAKKATVVLMPPGASFRVALDEGGLWTLGCPYVTEEPSHIKALVDILRHADLNVVHPTEVAWMSQTYEGISLQLESGTEVRFFFTINFNNIGVRGYSYCAPRLGDRSYLTTKPSLPNDLIVWAASTGPSAPKNGQSFDVRKQMMCDLIAKLGEKLK